MTELQGLQATPIQTFNHSISGGTIFFKLYYRPAVQMWFIDIQYNTKTINGLRVCANINLLNSWKKVLPFGLSVFVRDGNKTDPFLIDDFSTGRAILYLLSQEDLVYLEEEYAYQRSIQ